MIDNQAFFSLHYFPLPFKYFVNTFHIVWWMYLHRSVGGWKCVSAMSNDMSLHTNTETKQVIICLSRCVSWPELELIIIFFLQDVVLVNYSPDMFFKNRAMAIARKHLKQQGIVGLHQAPCFRGLLQRLPTMLQDQFSHEKVRAWLELNTVAFLLMCFSPVGLIVMFLCQKVICICWIWHFSWPS